MHISEVQSTAELSALEAFQERVADLNVNATTCLRFLRARNLDLDKTEIMIRNNQKWRQEQDIENVFKAEPPDFIKNDVDSYFVGSSKNLGPVFYIPMGKWKARYWIEKGKKEEVTLWGGYRALENILTKISEMNDKQSICICDMEDLTYYKVGHMDTLRVAYAGFQALEQNYPEILQNLTPWAFTLGFNFIKPILSQKTLDKFLIHGSDKKKWLPVVQELCMEDVIPKILGEI